MMLLVTYDLSGSSDSYEDFYNTLKKQGSWWHYLKSTWLLSTNKTPQKVVEALGPFLNDKDKLFVAVIEEGQHDGWLPEKAWNWIEKKEKSEDDDLNKGYKNA